MHADVSTVILCYARIFFVSCFIFPTKPLGKDFSFEANKPSKLCIYNYKHGKEICCCWQITTLR